MAASAPPPAYSNQFTNVDPTLAKQTSQASNQYQQSVGSLVGQANQLTPQVQTGFKAANVGGLVPQLNTEFAGANFGGPLDSTSQQLISQARGAAQAQQANQQQSIAQKYGQTPELMQILQQQSAAQSQLGQNPYEFQAAAAQRDRQAQEYQYNQQAQALTNQSRQAQSDIGAQRLLQQQDASTGAMQNTNAALAQKLSMAGVPAQAQQSLLAVLSALGQATGLHVSQPYNSVAGMNNPTPDWMYGGITGKA